MDCCRFDAWQHQRLAPPWWWPIMALERRIRDDLRPDWRRSIRDRDERRTAMRYAGSYAHGQPNLFDTPDPLTQASALLSSVT